MTVVAESPSASLPLLLLSLLFLLARADLTSPQIPLSPPTAPSPPPSPAPTPVRPPPSQIPVPSSPSPPAPAVPDEDIRDDAASDREVAYMEGDQDQASSKAGIAVGVITAAGMAWMGAVVYRKRRRNIQRAGYATATATATAREIL